MGDPTHEKLIADLGAEMNEARGTMDRGEISSLHTFFERALTLRAALQDAQANRDGVVPQSAHELQLILSSKTIADEYERGKSGDISVSPPPMLRLATGTTFAERKSWKSLWNDLNEIAIPDEIPPFLLGEQMRAGARAKLYDHIRDLLKPGITLLYGECPRDLWLLKLAGIDKKGKKVADGLEFLHGFVDRMEQETEKRARALYGADSERALFLWRIILDTRGKSGGQMEAFRKNCAQELANKEYAHAESILAETIQKYPSLFPESTKNAVRARGFLVEREKTLSPKDRRFADDLKEFEPIVGKMFRTKGGDIKKIEEIGMIRKSRQGMTAGVRIGYYERPTQISPNKPLRLDYTRVFLPSAVRNKMRREQWSEITI